MSNYTWGDAKQGPSGLWFKPGKDDNGRKHLLVSDSQKGIDSGGSHDHYWEMGDGKYGVQIRNKSGSGTIADAKGHVYERDSSFPSMVNKYLKDLFDTYCR